MFRGRSRVLWRTRTETLLMRFTDIMLVIPDLPPVMVVIALTRPSIFNIILVIGLLY
ncbi:hypothetical protein [Candidatus Villigracilis saccharophilus]|uniref:hypothetical protein n=1 Tax=Candidatus Villigracilis saccharophilus TaxID=3140684 RepID=UPI0031360016|nr:hypothetical protein [Anaerolineales bacterium]